MYIDDGALVACGNTWEEVHMSLITVYTACTSWLDHTGLTAEPDKTKLIFFRKLCNHTEPPNHIYLPIHSRSTYYKVTATHHLHYLGFFLDHKLHWKHHIKTMCN